MRHESIASSAALASIEDKAERNDYPWGTNRQVLNMNQCRFLIFTRLAGKHSVPNVSLAKQNQRLICGSSVSLSERSRLVEEAF